jgi:hypothetical protein
MDIWFPATIGVPLGMADITAELGCFTAYFTLHFYIVEYPFD